MKGITLFSPFSPDLGGGATNLRSLVPELKTLNVDWIYTARRQAAFPRTARVASPMTGGALWHDLPRVIALWSGLPTRTFRRVMSALTSRPSSGYWVVGHNEGILVARALARRGARVHLTIQDDVPDGMFGRSLRYRPLAPLVRPIYEDTLRRMASIDVTSEGMQRYYRERLGLSSVVVHPFISILPPLASASPRGQAEILVGHLGSIYAVEEWRSFLRALRAVARERGLRARMMMIGLDSKYRPVAEEFGETVELIGDLPEGEAVHRLAACHFLYAMYPFEPRSDVFRRTSLPTKVTSYLKARRPILAHSPPRSTLLEVVEAGGIGISCTSTDAGALEAAVRSALTVSIPFVAYDLVCREVYGRENVERLRSCLEAL